MRKFLLPFVLVVLSSFSLQAQTSMRFAANFTGNPVSYTFTSNDIAYFNATGGTFSTSGSNLCSGALRRTQLSTMILNLTSTSASAISIPGQSSGSSARTLTLLETATTLNGTYTTIPAASYTTSSTINSSSACGTIEISGLNIPSGSFVRFTFSGNVSVSGFDVTAVATGTPTTQASNIVFSNVGATSMTVGWTRGNGSNVAVFVKSGAGAITNPVDGTTYTANVAFPGGTQLGSSGYYCVYNGNATSVDITGLTASTTYFVQAFEYNGTGASAMYQTATATNNPNSQATTAPASDYRSVASGNWGDASTWQRYNGSAWVAAATAPSNTDALITIRNGHIVTAAANVSADELTIEQGGELDVASGVTFTVANGTGTDITLNGLLKNIGTFTLSTNAAMAVGATGVYEDAQPATTGTVTIPTATWAAGSTCSITGLVGVSGTDYAGLQGVRQSFSNFKVNTPNLVTKLLLTRNGGTAAPYMEVTGTLTVDATGSGTGIQVISTGNNNNTLVVGNYVQNGGSVFVIHNASSVATRSFTVTGNFTLNNNAIFDIGNTSGTSATNINYTNVAGNVVIASTATLQRTIQAGSSGTIARFIFNGSAAQSASFGLTNGAVNYELNNAAGLTITTDLVVNGTLTLTAGKIATGSNKLVIGATGSITGAGAASYVVGNLQKNIATGAATVTFEIGAADNYRPVSLAFGNVTTTGDITASVSQAAGDHPNIAGTTINAAKSVNRYWTLTNSGVVFDNYAAVFTFVAADVDAGANTANFIVRRYISAAWSSVTAGTLTATTSQATGLTGFGDFAIGEAVILPVVISFFKGETNASVNRLTWTTETEHNNAGFEIERSIDGKNFSVIGYIATRADRGNSTTTLNYVFTDEKPIAGNNYYRLKQIDADGKFNYSSMVKLSIRGAAFNIAKLYPNPATDIINLALYSAKAERITLRVTDISGKVVMQNTIALLAGDNMQQVNIGTLSPGRYFIHISGENLESSQTTGFTRL